MRNFKYRIWDGKCFRGNLNTYKINIQSGEVECWAWSDLYDEYYQTDQDVKFTLQQYTGLKDRKDMDLYEGDIIEGFDKQLRGQVVFSEEDAAFVFKSTTGGGAFLNETYLLNFTIIGNILENPELLK